MEKKKEEFLIKMIPVKSLHLDKDKNPRLPSKLVGKSDQDILDYMILNGNALELMVSIGEKGYFQGEPLLVIPDEKKNEFIVIEGNRRLSALMLLHNPSIAKYKKESIKLAVQNAKYKPTHVPVIMYSTRNEILDYLGYRHITGIKEWDSLAKAKYLRQLYEKSKEKTAVEKSKELARIIGSRPDYVRKLLCALSVYDVIEDNGYFDIPGLDDNISFSLITTSLGYKNLSLFLGLESSEEIAPKKINMEHLKELTIWLFDQREGKTRVGESRNLSQLARIVSNNEALNEFRSGATLESAFIISGGAEERVAEAIRNAKEKIELAYKYVVGIKLDTTSIKDLDQITKIVAAIKKVSTPDENV